MKNMKRMLSLILACLTAVFVLSSCGADTETSSNSGTAIANSEAGENEIIDLEQGENFTGPGGESGTGNQVTGSQATGSQTTGGDGKKYPGRVSNLNGRTVTIVASGYMKPGNGDEMAKRATKLYEKIGKEYNCKIVYNDTITYDQMAASIMSGSPKGDIWFAKDHTQYINQYVGKLIQPLNDLQVVDFTDTTKYSAAGQLGKINGVYYGVCPLTYGVTGGSAWVYNVLFFNKSILESAGYSADAMYALQKSGNWNWSKFEEIAKKVTQGKKYAINDSDLYFYNGLLASNGTAWVQEQNGSLKFTGTDTKNQEVLNFYRNLVKNGYMKVEPKQEGYSLKDKDEFIAGNVAFYAHPVWGVQHRVNGANFKWGILAMPKSPSAKDYVGDSSWASFFTIPRGVKKPNEPLTIIDEIMANPLFKGAEDEAQYTAFYSTYLQDTGSLETIKMLRSKERQSWSGATEGIKMTFGADYSWYPKVGEIANGASIATISGQVSSQYNNLLKDIFTKK